MKARGSAEPEKLIEAAAREGLTINMILTTHKHW
jgi:glyoxylase-like metal-dependent hydrolase (beta-lactamase superfamily II)